MQSCSKFRVKEVIVVEGRDDQAAVLRAVDAQTIATHGYGISKETIEQIRTAYNGPGIIIFTDPDHAGSKIREKLTGLFPDAGQAYLTRAQAEKAGDIGIENAEPKAIEAALAAAGRTERPMGEEPLSLEELAAMGLAGGEGSGALREALGGALGIGGGNAKAFCKKLNRMNIKREEIYKAWQALQNK